MKTTKLSLYRFRSICLVWLTLSVLLVGCSAPGDPAEDSTAFRSAVSSQSNSSTHEATESQISSQSKTIIEQEPDVDYTKYDGYAFYQDNGMLKYALKLDDGFQMRCYFQSGDPEPYEEIYTMDLSTAQASDNTLTIRTIRDGKGNDISDYFNTLTYTFLSDRVIMIVDRDESTLAGGAGDNLLTGTYDFTAAKNAPSSPAEKTFTPEELCILAQDYYETHNDFRPPESDSTLNNDGTITIHLYEKVSNGDGSYHTATSAWYTVDSKGVGTNDITGESIHLAE